MDRNETIHYSEWYHCHYFLFSFFNPFPSLPVSANTRKPPILHLNPVCIQTLINVITCLQRKRHSLLGCVLCLTLYDFGCLCFHCTRTSWATTRVTMRMSTISACMASWPLCLACILACSTLWKKKNLFNYSQAHNFGDS